MPGSLAERATAREYQGRLRRGHSRKAIALLAQTILNLSELDVLEAPELKRLCDLAHRLQFATANGNLDGVLRAEPPVVAAVGP